ncbi:MAG: beta-galactosidase [Clostridia bacterium]|nr:beta-galactosidase [Clostridia bacterium]
MNTNVNIPRAEYPRPNLVRDNWLCLNGEWDFIIDNTLSGQYLDYKGKFEFDKKIIVPFCPESKLSGIGNVDFMNCVWYKRSVTLPESFAGKEVILHFGACDWETNVFVNGKKVATHRGGYTPFSANITSALKDGENLIAVEARDDVRSGKQFVGKQSWKKFESAGCYYTRTTGIWQTVWMEAVDPAYVVNYNAVSNIDAPSVTLDVTVSEAAFGKKLSAEITYLGKKVGEAETVISSETVALTSALSEKHLWEVGKGRLYDVTFTILDGDTVLDKTEAYFGLRTVAMNKQGFFLNGEYVFGRFVLDQGFYPDGIYTAPTDSALEKDIIDSMSLGFNGARLHQKVFEPRFLYYADKHGYMLWDEAGNWGWDHTKIENIYNFLPEWLEEMERDKAHPSIIGWCPLNETWDHADGARLPNEIPLMIHTVTRAKDPTRPIITNSGFMPAYDDSGNFIGSAFDIHDYMQKPEEFAKVFEDLDKGVIKDQTWRNPIYNKRQIYDPKKTIFVSEYGGIAWVENGVGWGYGESVKSKEEFLERLEGLTAVLRENPEVSAFCYTQLYDVEQEKNGLMTYEREFKFKVEDINKIFSAPSVKERK